MATLLDIISGALTLIGQLGRGQTVAPEDGQIGLDETNLLLSQSSTKRLMLSYVAIRSYALSANDADYTIGPTGADFTAVRPTLIESAQINVPGTNIWLPMSVLDKPKWDAIATRGTVDEICQVIYPEYTYPNIAFHIHPKTSGTPTIRLGCWEELTQFPDVLTEVALPPAYAEWLKATLAIRLAPSYDQPVPANLLQRAADATAAVMQYNAQSMGGALGSMQTLQSPNVGNPILPSAPAAGGQ